MASKVTRAKIREALIEGWKATDIMELYGISHPRVTKERKYLGMGKWRSGKATTLGLTDIDFSPTPSITKGDIGATITVGPAPTADITPVDYVNAFEARVQEYHKTVAQLRQENDKLKEDNRKLRDELTQAVYQHRNWQPNSLVRTSLANGG